MYGVLHIIIECRIGAGLGGDTVACHGDLRIQTNHTMLKRQAEYKINSIDVVEKQFDMPNGKETKGRIRLLYRDGFDV
jgi:hypothetical protein